MSKDKELFNLFKRFAEDNYTLKDLEWIRDKVEDPYDKDSVERALRHYWYQNVVSRETKERKKVDFNLEKCLEKIHLRINQKSLSPFSSEDKRPIRRFMSRSLNFYYRAAAVLFIPLLGLVLMYFLNIENKQEVGEPVYSEVYAPKGSRIKMGLPDGTEVWLNHGSRLRYPQSFGKGTRKVFLRGEAYFDVRENQQKDFVVNASDMNVHVTGTQFNVMAYSDAGKVAVSLDEGSVELYKEKRNQKGEVKICNMNPGEHAIYNKQSNKMEITTGRNDIYSAWRDGKMIFRNDDLEEIVKRLERWYNVEIILEDQQVANFTFTATFSDETLPQILDLLSKAAPLEYQVTPRIKQSDNSFSKSQVIISLKD